MDREGSDSVTHYGWIEVVFVAAVALGLGGWQLWSINREIARDRAARDKDQQP